MGWYVYLMVGLSKGVWRCFENSWRFRVDIISFGSGGGGVSGSGGSGGGVLVSSCRGSLVVVMYDKSYLRFGWWDIGRWKLWGRNCNKKEIKSWFFLLVFNLLDELDKRRNNNGVSLIFFIIGRLKGKENINYIYIKEFFLVFLNLEFMMLIFIDLCRFICKIWDLKIFKNGVDFSLML